MSPPGCLVSMMVMIFTVRHIDAVCQANPDSFLPYGRSAGDSVTPLKDLTGKQTYVFFYASTIFGKTGMFTTASISVMGLIEIKPYPGTADDGVVLMPRNFGRESIVSLRVGTIYMRHRDDSTLLERVNEMACGSFDNLIVVTFECVGEGADKPLMNYQVIFASGSEKSVAIFNYGTPYNNNHNRYIEDNRESWWHPLKEDDILDDGITMTDVTNFPTEEDDETLPVLDCSQNSQIAAPKTCEIYANGTVKTLNGDTVSDSLIMKKNFVATVDKTGKKNNKKYCKFFLMIPTSGSYVPEHYVRIGVGVHPNNPKQYLRKFQFSLEDDSFVKEFGYSLSSDKLLNSGDMPYTMDDTDSDEPLGITVDATDDSDGWIIKSATCGYSFTYLWGGNDPMVTMTLEGDRYDDRIVGTCGDIST